MIGGLKKINMTKIYEAAKKYAQEKAGLDISIKEAYEDGMVDMLEWVCGWLKFNTNWDMEWDECGRNLDFGKIDELRKDMEE